MGILNLHVDGKSELTTALYPKSFYSLNILSLHYGVLLQMAAKESELNPFLEFLPHETRDLKSIPMAQIDAFPNPIETSVGYAFSETQTTLTTHLTWQLMGLKMEKKERWIAEMLIQSLDENGYLVASVQELADSWGVSLPELEHVRSMFHHLDPAGVAGENLMECLMIQLTRFEQECSLARSIISHGGLEVLAESGMQGLTKHLKRHGVPASKNEIQAAVSQIRSLNPKPGSGFASPKPYKHVPPDVELEWKNGSFHITVFGNIVRLEPEVCRLYQTLRRNSKEFRLLKKQYQQALTFMESIERRISTLQGLIEYVCKYQKSYFQGG